MSQHSVELATLAEDPGLICSIYMVPNKHLFFSSQSFDGLLLDSMGIRHTCKYVV